MAVNIVGLEEAGKAPNANPKKAFGDKKPRLSLTPLTAQLAQQEAQLDGALKYGEVNWRTNHVETKMYIDAAMRHLRLYENGEKLARDTKVQNLGAVMACCAILIDAEAHGTLIDNRTHSKPSCDALHEAEGMVASLKAMQTAREVKPDPDVQANDNKAGQWAAPSKHQFRPVDQALIPQPVVGDGDYPAGMPSIPLQAPLSRYPIRYPDTGE